MQNHLGGIYAAGDCAEAMHLVTGRPAYIPLGTTANKQAAWPERTPRRTRAFRRRGCTCALSVFGLGVGMTGLSVEQAVARDSLRFHRGSSSRAGAVFGASPQWSSSLQQELRPPAGRVVTGEQGVAGRINVVAAALHIA